MTEAARNIKVITTRNIIMVIMIKDIKDQKVMTVDPKVMSEKATKTRLVLLK